MPFVFRRGGAGVTVRTSVAKAVPRIATVVTAVPSRVAVCGPARRMPRTSGADFRRHDWWRTFVLGQVQWRG